MGGGKGGGGGMNPDLASEAYTNFQGYGASAPGTDVGAWPGYADWASENPTLAPYAQQGWQAGQASASSQRQMQDFMYALQRPQEIAGIRSYGSNLASTLSDPNSSYENIAEAVLRTRRWGTENEMGYDNFVGGLAQDIGLDEGYGFVWDENQVYQYPGEEVGLGNLQGGWRTVSAEEFATLSADREGTMEQYQGLIGSDNVNMFESWSEAVAGEGSRDELYGRYLDLAGTAADYVTEEMDRERQNAALLGHKYDITDEQKAGRVNDYFATLWSDTEQMELQGLVDTWGAPEGFTGFTVTRGDASVYTPQDTEATPISVSQGVKPGVDPVSPLLDEEESLLGEELQSVLGG